MNKICKYCGEINSSSAMTCTNCQKTLTDAEIRDEGKSKTGNHESLIGNNSTYKGISYKGYDDVVSIGSWIGIILILAIPIVDIIALFVMAFGSNNDNIKNFAKASLIISAIVIVLSLMFAACMRQFY